MEGVNWVFNRCERIGLETLPMRNRRGRARPQQMGMNVEHGGRETVTVGHHFADERQRSGLRRRYVADHAAEIEREFRVVFAREALHAFIIRKTRHVQMLDPAVAGGEQGSFQQRSTNAAALPRLLDAERHASVGPSKRSSPAPRRTPSTKKP
jgi:hypothetical protein